MRPVRPAALESLWWRLFGPPDLGGIDFAALTRRRTPNDSLACLVGFCPQASPDIVPPVLPVSTDRLRTIVAEVAAADSDTVLVASDPDRLQDRYVARTRVLRFPDTIDVRVIRQNDGQATLAIYSRSQVGSWDLGINRARIARWLQAIGALA